MYCCDKPEQASYSIYLALGKQIVYCLAINLFFQHKGLSDRATSLNCMLHGQMFLRTSH